MLKCQNEIKEESQSKKIERDLLPRVERNKTTNKLLQTDHKARKQF